MSEVPVLIGVYPSVFFPTRHYADDLARHAIGMPHIDPARLALSLEVEYAWVEGDDQSGKVYATLMARSGPNMLTLEYLKMRELEEAGYTVETVMQGSYQRLIGYQ